MAAPLNPVTSFSSANVSRSCFRTSVLKATHFGSPLGICGSRRLIKEKKWGLCLSVADSDQVATNTNKSSGKAENSLSDDEFSVASSPSLKIVDESQPRTPGVSTGSRVSSQQDPLSSPDSKPKMTRSILTAREKLRAARVLSRYTETKPSKSELGNKSLEALIKSDGGKDQSGLPEAPTNLFDDSKRGLPKQGLTFEFPGGADLFGIIFSVVFISTVMFATTYIVWKAGAIHFNE
ncbi:uncharacterized protein LOC131165677 [Malania oleifera]|uniref:uncharacterized protein LOC131165677 n=1 Tax=Malania oleifera TaxID=397392 RepID=UPI0025AE59AE|nr:uncharacterized protein LOC131165677 [Malania oleifera]